MKTTPGGAVPSSTVGRRGPAPRSILFVFRAPGSRTGLARFIHEELGGPLKVGHQRIMDGAEFEGSAAHPIRKGGAVEIDALAAVDLGLPVERKVIGTFADQHMGDCGFGSACRPGSAAQGQQPARPPSVQDRQAYLGRRVTMTRNWRARCPAFPRRPRRCNVDSHRRRRSGCPVRSPLRGAADAWAAPRD